MEGEKWPPLHTRRGVQYSDISGTGLMPCPVKFSTSSPGADRIHYVNEDDIRIVLSRLPDELWDRLRTVHFNDRSRGARVLGYVNRGRRDIALCALPPRMSLIQALRNGQRPEEFGARRGEKWPRLAIRRFMLYDVFLHELGHLQLIDEDARSVRRKFAHETRAQEFAMYWCNQLWSEAFSHPDPVHNPPAPSERTRLSAVELTSSGFGDSAPTSLLNAPHKR
jgi:hypothetical protein